jgi:predicted subunit of tRNA(5-methylaminomethyl-2-thiouridylate) methyltransferase
MSQCERLLDRLQVAPITPLEAWSELGVERLAARVFDLRESGHHITKETVIVANRFGEACHVARYRLVK